MAENLISEILEKVVHLVAEKLSADYVFPEIGDEMAIKLLDNLSQEVYEEINDLPHIGSRITSDIRDISKDGHLALYHFPAEAAALESRKEKKNEKEVDQDIHWWQPRPGHNYGLQKLEILPGNVGYVAIEKFAPISLGGSRTTAAMNFLSDCEALIFDLRSCGVGDPYMVQLFESYLFGSEPKLMLTQYHRPTEKRQELWTLPHVDGRRMPDVPVYILTSSQTFSGGEDFAYTLKHHGRASIVGEKTGGGGHTIDFLSIGEGFVLVLPTGRPVHPVSGGNWEGTGVEPDVSVSADEALHTAQLLALEKLRNTAKDPQDSRRLDHTLTRLKAMFQPLKLDDAYLKQVEGYYGQYQITLGDNQLTISESGSHVSWKMLPITENMFYVDDDYNASFEFDDAGEATTLVWHEIASEREIRSNKTELGMQ